MGCQTIETNLYRPNCYEREETWKVCSSSERLLQKSKLIEATFYKKVLVSKRKAIYTMGWNLEKRKKEERASRLRNRLPEEKN